MDEWLSLFLFVTLIGFSGFFSGSETALFCLNKLHLKKLEKDKPQKAKLIETLLAKPKQLLIAILLGNEVVNIASTSVATGLAIRFLNSEKVISIATTHSIDTGMRMGIGLLITIFILSVILLVFGEITPKLIAVNHPVRFASIIAKPVGYFCGLVSILVNFMLLVTNSVLSFFGVESPNEIPLMNSEELQSVINKSEENGILEAEEKKMIQSIVEMGETLVYEVMTPRVDIASFQMDMTVEDALKEMQELNYSRYIVYKENIDDVTGILYVKDVLQCIQEGNLSKPISDLTKEVMFVPEMKKVDSLLSQFKREKKHIAVVVDEYGGTEGLITLEDVVEEIFGEILDEYDVEEKRIEKIGTNKYRVDARMPLDEFFDEIQEKIELEHEDDYETVGGLLFDLFGDIPNEKDVIKLHHYEFLIEKMDNNRIDRVIFTVKTDVTAGEQ